ncbi:MAG: hypothetical protein JSS66_07330 [Armatimonadetes bacterium]|nr:hypothetical protein [Armatimonadota bacterium]
MRKHLTQAQMLEKSFQRPSDYFELSAEIQWAIDKSLGILDWDGAMTADERARFEAHYDHFKNQEA